jgi:hypothetical protein
MGGGDASGAGAPEAEQETQEQKRAAAAAYDYEGDARWADYWSNVLVPPHLAAKPEVQAHFRRKFYQRFVVSRPAPSLPPRPLLLLNCSPESTVPPPPAAT